MPGAFQYKPKFVDIRVRPPSEKDEAEADVHALKPGERACDHPGCRRPATARAPKARDMLNEHYWFCQPHAAEYTRNWNFFAGLPEAEVRRRQQEELMTGGRPTWEMKAGRMAEGDPAEAAEMFAGMAAGHKQTLALLGYPMVMEEAQIQAQARRLAERFQRAYAV